MNLINSSTDLKHLLAFGSAAVRGIPNALAFREACVPGNKIDYREKLSYEEFAKEYLYPLKPVVIQDALAKWKALGSWTPEFFKEKFGEMEFGISDTEYGQVGHTARSSTFTMAEFIDRVLKSAPDSPAPYFRRKDLCRMFPSLIKDIDPLPDYCYPNWLSDKYFVKRVSEVLNPGGAIYLFIGGTGAVFPVLHYDGAGTHAFLMQIYGQKQYLLYPPEQECFLYPSSSKPNLSLVNDVESPDLGKFPLFAKAKPISFTLGPGELLFIPAHWWHTVKIVTPSITVSTNLLNESNWHELVTFVAMRQSNVVSSLASRMYLGLAGTRRAWRDRGWRRRSAS